MAKVFQETMGDNFGKFRRAFDFLLTKNQCMLCFTWVTVDLTSLIHSYFMILKS